MKSTRSDQKSIKIKSLKIFLNLRFLRLSSIFSLSFSCFQTLTFSHLHPTSLFVSLLQTYLFHWPSSKLSLSFTFIQLLSLFHFFKPTCFIDPLPNFLFLSASSNFFLRFTSSNLPVSLTLFQTLSFSQLHPTSLFLTFFKQRHVNHWVSDLLIGWFYGMSTFVGLFNTKVCHCK